MGKALRVLSQRLANSIALTLPCFRSYGWYYFSAFCRGAGLCIPCLLFLGLVDQPALHSLFGLWSCSLKARTDKSSDWNVFLLSKGRVPRLCCRLGSFCTHAPCLLWNVCFGTASALSQQ